MHKVVYLLKFAHTNGLEWCVDQAATEEVNGLASVLAVADI